MPMRRITIDIEKADTKFGSLAKYNITVSAHNGTINHSYEDLNLDEIKFKAMKVVAEAIRTF